MATLKAITMLIWILAEIFLCRWYSVGELDFWLFQVALFLAVLIPFMRVQPVIQLQIADNAEERAEETGELQSDLEEMRTYFNDECDSILADIQRLRKMLEESKEQE